MKHTYPTLFLPDFEEEVATEENEDRMPKSATIATIEDCKFFWNEVSKYFKRLDKSHLRLMMEFDLPWLQENDYYTDIPTQSAVDLLLSCLVPTTELSMHPKQYARSTAVRSEGNEIEPYLIEQLITFGLIQSADDLPRSSLKEKARAEVTMLTQELEELKKERQQFLIKIQQQFLDELRKDQKAIQQEKEITLTMKRWEEYRKRINRSCSVCIKHFYTIISVTDNSGGPSNTLRFL